MIAQLKKINAGDRINSANLKFHHNRKIYAGIAQLVERQFSKLEANSLSRFDPCYLLQIKVLEWLQQIKFFMQKNQKIILLMGV